MSKPKKHRHHKARRNRGGGSLSNHEKIMGEPTLAERRADEPEEAWRRSSHRKGGLWRVAEIRWLRKQVDYWPISVQDAQRVENGHHGLGKMIKLVGSVTGTSHAEARERCQRLRKTS